MYYELVPVTLTSNKNKSLKQKIKIGLQKKRIKNLLRILKTN